MAAKMSETQKKKINELRKKLRMRSIQMPSNHDAAKKLIFSLEEKFRKSIAECPVVDMVSRVESGGTSSIEACCTPGCPGTTTSRSHYCEECKRKREKGKMTATTNFIYSKKECVVCGEEFQPNGPRSKYCSDNCKNGMVTNVTPSAAPSTEISTIIHPSNTGKVRICGLVGCDNHCGKSKSTKKNRMLKYCCDEHRTTANTAYKEYARGAITIDALKGIVKDIYFRGQHTHHMEVIQQPSQENVSINAASLNAIVLRKTKILVDDAVAKILESAKFAAENLQLQMDYSLECHQVVANKIKDRLTDQYKFSVELIFDEQISAAVFAIDWSNPV